MDFLKKILAKIPQSKTEQTDERVVIEGQFTHRGQALTPNKTPEDITLVELPDEVTGIFGIDKAHIVKEDEESVRYPIPENMQNQASDDILTINQYIEIASRYDSNLKPLRIVASDIVYKPFIDKYKFSSMTDTWAKEEHRITKVEEKVFTSLGKLTKFPFVLHFQTRKKHHMRKVGDYEFDVADEVFGKIHYLKNGKMGRIEIVHWNSGKLHSIYVVEANKELVVDRVFTTDTKGNRFLKYKRQK